MYDNPGAVQQDLASQGPLLFFVHKRRRRAIESLLIFGVVAILLTFVSWKLHIVAGQKSWWAILVVCCTIAFFAYCDVLLLANTFHLIRPGPALILYEEGIHDRRLSKGIISWKEIIRMRQQEVLSDWSMFYFDARNPTAVRRKLRVIQRLPSLINQVTGRGTFVVNFVHLAPGPDNAVRYILLKLSEHGGDPAFPAVVNNQSAPRTFD